MVTNMYFAYGETECSYLRQKDKRLCAVIDRIGHIERAVLSLIHIFVGAVHTAVGRVQNAHAGAVVNFAAGEIRAGIDAVSYTHLCSRRRLT